MEIFIDLDDIRAAERALAKVRYGFPKALKRTLDKTAAGTKTDMVSFVRSRYGYKAKSLRDRITVYKCPSYATLNSTVRSVGPGVHLTDIVGTRQTKKGVTLNVKKSTGRKLIPHAFIAPGQRSKKLIAFIRETEGGKMVGRTPISPLYAPHPEVVLNTDENWPEVEKKANERLQKHFEHEVDVVLKGFA